MLITILISSVVALVLATVVLLVTGHRVRTARPVASLVLAALVVFVAGVIAARLWQLPSGGVLIGQVFVFGAVGLVVLVLPAWNAPGHVAFGTTVGTFVAFLVLSGWATVAGGLSPLGVLASMVLWCLELSAFLVATTYAFESIDAVCRTRWTRIPVPPDPFYRPKVSLHVPAYAEPPDMLIETIASLEALDYDDFEIVVVDNNTTDEDLWRPVERYCAGRPRVTFVHVNPWPGYKSGALNLALRRHTDPSAEIVGVVDADYLVRPDYLSRTVGHFVDQRLAFLQTPQDYREWEGDRYLTACHDAYRYFFETAMVSRNERNSIIFGGTMGLIRRSALDDLGGWDERCITEDAELSLRMLRAGWSGLYLNQSFGRGIMPLTFGAFKRQMFRWCFGGIQILRTHRRSLMPWNRDPANGLSRAQRLDYLFGGLQWFGSLVGLGFTLVLAVVAAALGVRGHLDAGPLVAAAVALPVSILLSGLVRALWALHHRAGVGYRRAAMALLTWLSVSWAVGLACLQGLVRSEGVFLRTPKWRGSGRLTEALEAAKVETALALGAFTLALFMVARSLAGPVLVVLFVWQGLVYATAPTMAWLNQRSHLSVRLTRLQRAEERRERLTALRPRVARISVGALAGTAIVLLLLLLSGGSGNGGGSLFTPPRNVAGPAPGPTSPNPSSPGRTGGTTGSTTNPPTTTGTTRKGGRGNGNSVERSTTTSASLAANAGAGAATSHPTSTLVGSPTGTTVAASATTTTHPSATTSTHPSATTTTHPSATTTTHPSATTTTHPSATTTTNPRRP